jgi:uncharacterized membrane protein
MNLKVHKRELILSSLLFLLPMAVGLILWNRLPDSMYIHWGVNNQPDGTGSKAFVVFGFPLLLLGMHWFALWITSKDPKHQNQGRKATAILFWIIPLLSCFLSLFIYSTALGVKIGLNCITFLPLGIMFVAIGNYMPKVKQNYTLGIKITWTLSNEENWNATHRFAGKTWFLGGLIMIFSIFLPANLNAILLFPVIFILVAIPVLYSWLYYKKQVREGNDYPLWHSRLSKSAKVVYITFTLLLVFFLVFFLFSGKISITYQAEDFTIDASFYTPLTIDYAEIASVELRDEPVDGTREMGFGSARLEYGTFRNEEFGLYTRYTYTGCDSVVILTSTKGKVMVLSGATREETLQIYNTLLNKIG